MTSQPVFFFNIIKMLSKFTHFSSTMLVVGYFCQWDSLLNLLAQKNDFCEKNINDLKELL